MKKFIFLLSLSVLFSCSDDSVDCSNALPPPVSFTIEFRNQEGDPLLDTQFLQDSFKLSSNNSLQYLQRIGNGDSSRLLMLFSSLESEETYQLELDDENIDSLQFNFTRNVIDCGVAYSLKVINYNGQTILPEGNSFGSNISFTRN